LPKTIDNLECRLGQARCLYEQGKNSKWQDQAEEILGRIRQAWELAVEQVLAPVIQRFEERVQTRGLRQVAVLTQEDCVSVDEARERCSRLQHRASPAAGAAAPTPDDLDHEIALLRQWYDTVTSKQEKVR